MEPDQEAMHTDDVTQELMDYAPVSPSPNPSPSTSSNQELEHNSSTEEDMKTEVSISEEELKELMVNALLEYKEEVHENKKNH